MKRIVLIFVAALLLGIHPADGQKWVMQQMESSSPDSIVATLEAEARKMIGEPTPALTIRSLDGSKSETLEDYTGKTLVINFWKTTCSGCKAQLPDLSKLQKTHRDRGLRVIYASPEDEQTIRDFLSEREIAGIQRRVRTQNLSCPYQLLATPSAFVIGPEGKIRESWFKPEKFAQLKKRVAPYLSGK